MRAGSLVVLLLICQITSAQKEIVSQNNAWLMYTGNHKFSDNWGIHTEYQFRRSDILKDPQQDLLRFGADYYRNNCQFTLGYAWIKTYPYGEQPISVSTVENRIWQQFILKSKAGRFDFQHRYRLEQRLIENWKALPTVGFSRDGYLFRQRFRYRFLITVPLSRKELSDNTLFVAVYDEVFLGFGKGIGKNVLDQNRLYGALGWRFNKNFNIQLGYLNQYVIKADGIKAERNHTLQLGISYNLDLRKQKDKQ